MAVEIKCEKIEDGLIQVNGKQVRRDMNGNWINPANDLDMREAKYFGIFLETVRRTGSEKLKKATYTL